MSNESSKSKRKRYTIEPLSMSQTEADQLRGVVGRLMGKLPARSIEDSSETSQNETTQNETAQDEMSYIEKSRIETARIETAQIGTAQSGQSHKPSQIDTAQARAKKPARRVNTGSLNLSSPDLTTPKIMQELPDVDGFLKLYNQVIDHLYPQLSESEQVVHLQLFRLSWGFGRPTVEISLPALSRRANVSRSTAHRAVSRLCGRGLIRVEATIRGAGREQGNRYYVEPPPALLKVLGGVNTGRLNLSSPDPGSLTGSANLTPIKESTKDTQKDTHTKDVGVGESRFSLEECRQYAEHLKESGQGITNPGGYGKTIFRTGEADAAIQAWLETKSQPPLDISQCPDCHGVGFLYPNGIEGGVVKCKHEKLLQNK